MNYFSLKYKTEENKRHMPVTNAWGELKIILVKPNNTKLKYILYKMTWNKEKSNWKHNVWQNCLISDLND